MKLKQGLLGLAMAAALALPGAGRAEDVIKIGNTMPYSGPASAFGEIGNAMKAYFQKVNDEGGVNGARIEFISYDDAYSPPKTVEQTRRLIERDKVNLLSGTFGSAQNIAIQKYVNQRKIPHLFLASAANIWSKPDEFPWTMGFQPNAAIEGQAYGEYIVANFPDKKIAILYQNDDYGRGFLEGIDKGLGDKTANIVGRATFEVTDPTIDTQITNLQRSGAEILIDIATPKFAAQAIRKVAELGWKPTHFIMTTSASVDQVLKPAGFDISQGLITAAYLKDPTDPRWANDPAMNDFRAFMDKYYPTGNKGSVYAVIGYSIAQSTVHVLEKAGPKPTNEAIMKAATSLDYDLPLLLPGLKLQNSTESFHPIASMQMMRFDGEAWVAND
ncbi:MULTISPECIES: ABC transporter substrate-binding protein [unclassified Haematobacter]|uniref:ABC transporter substrate-binding protein n=1 Tax=unclassified Haematobacter TaxID=2640585 RepID=UPI0025C45F7D|nr:MULTISPECIES: ABC transporter substrate-binding protein [unclassified Haematobacter]